MRFFRLRIAPDPSREGDSADEWFAFLKDAKARRRNYISHFESLEQLPDSEDDLQIDEVVLVELPRRELVLRLLNQKAFIRSDQMIVPSYRPKPASARRRT